ncbi:MAG: hypothetical protein KDA91_00885 [Planctomycetaceae bacterium]|nr:hypothetical protein [Planctomycetaceae bacterium]
MLSRRISLATSVAMALVVGSSSTAVGQYYPGSGCSSCGTAAPAPVSYAPAPVSYGAASCTPIQPVMQTCYQTVPVTTYTREKQTVERPYYETSYEEREVTVMRPVTQQREVEVPTVSYQNVTEYRTVNRDAGRWVTRYQPIMRCSPCQVDPRPGVIGWLNRTGYSMQTAFMPNYTTSREYVPNMMACTVPVTRQVAVQGTRRVTVSETKMVAEKKVERVPVQKLAYRKEEVTVMRPQTAYRTVPIGTSVAYGGGYGPVTAYSPYYGGAMTAFGGTIIEEAPRTALGPKPDTIGGGSSSTRTTENVPFPEDPRSSDSSFKRTEDPIRGSSLERPFPGDDPATETNNELPLFPSAQLQRKPVNTVGFERKQEATSARTASATGWRRTNVARAYNESRLSDRRSSDPKLSLADNK